MATQTVVQGDTPRPLRSGLARSIGGFTAFLFGLHCISLSSSGLIPYSWVASVWPGASIIGVLFIALIFCAIHGVTYGIIGSTVPRTGADYVLASRVLSPGLSFVASWTLVLFSGIVAGGLAAWVPKSAVPALLRPMAIIFQDSRYNQVADFSTSAVGSMILGTAIIGIVLLSLLQDRIAISRMLALGFVLGIVAWGIILFVLATSSPAEFRDAWNTFMAQGNPSGLFENRVALAKSAGMEISSSVLMMTLAGLIMGFWIYYGYYIPTFFSEEVRDPTRSLFISSLGALVVSFVIFSSGAALLERLTGPEWIAAEGYLFNNSDAVARVNGGVEVEAMPWITFYAAILKPSAPLIFFVAFAWVFTLINLVQTYFFYASRIIYAWSLDRVIPDWILGRNPLEPTPTRSLYLIAALAITGLADAAFGGPLGTQLTFVFFAVLTGIVPVLAVTILPKLRPAIFAQIPPFFQKRLAGIPLSSWFGGVTLLYLGWMVVASFAFPAVGIANPARTLSILAVFLLSGLCVFYGMRWYRLNTQGIDILATYAELPQEDQFEEIEFDETPTVGRV